MLTADRGRPGHWYLAVVYAPGCMLKQGGVADDMAGRMLSGASSDVRQSIQDGGASNTPAPTRDKGHRTNGPHDVAATTRQDHHIAGTRLDSQVVMNTYILTLDSLGNPHPEVGETIGAYLQSEALSKQGIDKANLYPWIYKAAEV